MCVKVCELLNRLIGIKLGLNMGNCCGGNTKDINNFEVNACQDNEDYLTTAATSDDYKPINEAKGNKEHDMGS